MVVKLFPGCFHHYFSQCHNPLASAVHAVLVADGLEPGVSPPATPPTPVQAAPLETDPDTVWGHGSPQPYRTHATHCQIDNLTADDVITSFGSIFTDPDEEDLQVIDRVRKILDRLPVIEADFIDLYFFRHVRQTDIATIFGVSQPTVCYRLQRAIQRIKYLLEVPKLESETLRADLKGFFTDSMDVEILVLMYETTCQSETAKRLGVTQGFVRHRFIRSTRRMSKHATMQFYGEVFSSVAENLNLLREVQRSFPTIRSGFVLDS